jgi:methylmalonyl-CoA/ethylmalonyl-CoA epimerase
VSEETPVYGSGSADAVRGLSHIAIATPDADTLATSLVNGLGARRGDEELLDDGGLRVVFVHLGPVTFELLEPKHPEHTVAKFLTKRGPGLHHVSLDVAGIEGALAACQAAGIEPIDRAPRPGAHGTRVAFLHPRSLGGVLIELSEKR